MAPRRRYGGLAAAALSIGLVVTACSDPSPAPAGSSSGGDSTTVSAGMVAAIDQIGLPAALDQGFFEKEGLNVEIAEPYASGTDQLNALDAGQIDIAQVGSPVLGAVLSGADYVLLGNYTGSAAKYGSDETMAVVARDGSGIKEGDLRTLKGKKIGVTVGSINHLYLLAVLEDLGMSPDDVKIVNTAPPDMAVGLQTSGIDAAIVWDPFPMMITDQVEGSYDVARGGDYIGFLGYVVAERTWAEENPDVVKSFLTARAKADQWMRKNPDDAAEVASRWLSDLDPEIASESMKYNVTQLDPRISACNYAALNDAMVTLDELDALDGTFDVNKIFEPSTITGIAKDQPAVFDDLKPIPKSAQITDGFTYDPKANQCPQ
ncbi:ABC transporter substrate-binding protein [Solicola gregarius]|uniref:ABC transporter substrate-binding protein n=1 Tax=Solicola gregarius TaxID=2908642 RepID=A0AA46THK9_9ACTN|nr:ABC transporter substrate-binding protein [Solicola gregarius]UYM04967.1 ABC transporter substrate-binding protein [Solicola gregarius]